MSPRSAPSPESALSPEAVPFPGLTHSPDRSPAPTSARPMLEIDRLSKRYGQQAALDEVSFTAHEGEVFGLLGPNGAGKTTLLRTASTLLRASGGAVRVAGHDVAHDPETVRRQLGVVNGGMGLPPRLTGLEVLREQAALYGLSRAAADARILVLRGELGLEDVLDRQTQTYSTGMKQRVVVARAVIHDPPVLLLDEAASGLDILARRQLMDYVLARRQPGRLVVYSTHVMSEAEELCDRVVILNQGRVLALGTVPEILASAGQPGLERAFFELVTRQARAGQEAVTHAP